MFTLRNIMLSPGGGAGTGDSDPAVTTPETPVEPTEPTTDAVETPETPTEPKVEPEAKKEEGEEEDFDFDRAMNTINKQREIEKTLKAEIKTLKATLKAGGFDPQELNQLRQRVAELESEKVERTHREIITEAARAAGALYPETIFDLSRTNLKVEGGEIKNVEEVIASLKEKTPGYFQAIQNQPKDKKVANPGLGPRKAAETGPEGTGLARIKYAISNKN